MGLYMYLTKRTYVKNWDHNPKKFTVDIRHDGQPLPCLKPERISYIEEEVMYWRKANHIHNWFVKNAQRGVDDCGDYHVSEELLKQLLGECKKVVAEYDEYYIDDCKETIIALEKILDEKDDRGYSTGELYYTSSW